LIDVSPAVAAGGAIYFSAPYGKLTAFGADGAARWEFNGGDNLNASPVIGGDGIIYICCNHRLNAVSAPDEKPPAKSSWPMFRANARHTGRVQNVN
jgi:outer membrane protein assembly factor BamB